MPMISYIVPAYNNEKTIKKCIESILIQNSLTFEIIIVENGSTDKTFDIAQKLSESDDRILAFQSEKGVSNARNKGINESKGKYISFVDCDDTLLAGADTFFKDCIEKYPDVDIFSAHSDSQSKKSTDFFEHFNREEVEIYLSKSLIAPTKSLTVWAKLFSADFIKSNEIYFNSGLTHSEDSDFVIRASLKAKSIVCAEKIIYHYSFSENSAVRNSNKISDNYITALNETKKSIEQSCNLVKEAFNFYILDHLLIILVHETFIYGNYFDQVKEAKELLREDIFSNALNSANLKITSFTKRILFFFLKNKIYFPIYCACKLRQLKNSK